MDTTYVPEPPHRYPGGEADEEYTDFSSFSRRLRRRFWVPLLLLLCGLLYAFRVSSQTPPAYESQVRILFPGMNTGAGGVSSLASSLGVGGAKPQPMDMYAEVLKSTRIVLPIAQKYHLDRYGIRVKTAEDVQGIVKVKTNAPAATLTLTAVAPKAELAPLMAKDLCEALSGFVRDAALSDNKNTASYLSGRIRDVEGRHRPKDEELRRFQESHRLAGAAGGAAPGSSAGPALAAKLNDVNTSLKANEAKIAEVRRQLALQVEHPERLAGEGTPLAQKWRDQLGTKMHQLALSEAQYGPDYPEVVLLKKEIADIKMRIAREISGARYAMEQGITPELAGLIAEREALVAQQASLNDLVSNTPAQEMRLSQLNRETLLLATLYSTLQQKYQEAQLAEMNDPSRFVFLDEPTVPLRPARPSWKRNLAMGALAGLILGLFLAVSFPERQAPVKGVFTPAEKERLPEPAGRKKG
jgi:uncharacterized protein involved in exopolysaccharide biosynthesis